MNLVKLLSSIRLLNLVRTQADAIGVALSFGKDSLAVLELCSKIFPRVEAYYLYRVRDLEIVNHWCEVAKQRWGVSVRLYPHFYLSDTYRHSLLQPHWKAARSCHLVRQKHSEAKFRQDAEVEWLAYGWRASDSLSRALIMKRCAGLDLKARRVYPLRGWRRQEVLDFLAERGITPPESGSRKEQSGLDFHPDSLAFLKKNYPGDYAKWLRDFPFLEARLLGQQAVGNVKQSGLGPNRKGRIQEPNVV